MKESKNVYNHPAKKGMSATMKRFPVKQVKKSATHNTELGGSNSQSHQQRKDDKL